MQLPMNGYRRARRRYGYRRFPSRRYVTIRRHIEDSIALACHGHTIGIDWGYYGDSFLYVEPWEA